MSSASSAHIRIYASLRTNSKLPLLRQAQSASNTFLEEGQNTALCVSQLVQLLQQSSNSTESLARLPLIEYLKQQADRLSSSADPCTTAIWQLTGTAIVLCSEFTINLAAAAA